MALSSKLTKAARMAVEECLGVAKHETVLVITDEPLRAIGQALWEAARETGAEALLTELIPRLVNGTEPPPALADFMSRVDVLIIPTSKSMSHTQARRNACQAGVRCATLPGITEESMIRTLGADWEQIAKRSKKVARILMDGEDVQITTISGTKLSFSIKGRKGIADTGQLTTRGVFGNLPAGEAYVAPVEGTANGTLVVEGSFAGVGLLKRPMTLTIEHGYVTKFSGGEESRRLETLVAPHGKLGRNIAELGVGTHDKAILTGNVLEDEKILGTIHIAIGDNASMGGNVRVPIHLDSVILKPSVTVDGRPLLKYGKLLV